MPSVSLAGPIIRGGDNVSVGIDQILEGDFYGAGETVTISGIAEHDVVVAGSNVTINGNTAGDIAAAGMTVQIHGNVEDDVRIAGGEIIIASTVKGDVVVAGGALTVLSTARIEGDVIFWGGELTIEGPVDGSLHGNADVVRVDAHVGGDIEYKVQKSFVLGDKASVEGDVVYGGPELVRAQNAVVVGNIQHTGAVYESEGNSHAEMFLFMLLVILFSSLSMYFVARHSLQTIIEKSLHRIGFNGLVGLGVFIATPFVAMLLLVSIVGSLVGLMLLFGYITVLIASFIITIVMLGNVFQKYVLKNESYTIFTPFLGAILFTLLLYVPFIGSLAILALTLVNFGSITTSIYHKLRA